MSQLVENCPRCRAQKTTFDVLGSNEIEAGPARWEIRFEAFCVCRNCGASSIFRLKLSKQVAHSAYALGGPNGLVKGNQSLNDAFVSLGHVSAKDHLAVPPPLYLPKNLEDVFREGATCLQADCYNAAGTMFRLCVDHATHELLPKEEEEDSPKGKQQRDLGLRLQWLFDHKKLPEDLHELAQCIKEDGNDGAHRGTLSEADAEDLLDFTVHLLERRYTIPGRVAEAAARRASRPR